MKKKICLALFCLAIMVPLFGCGKNSTEEQPATQQAEQTTKPSEEEDASIELQENVSKEMAKEDATETADESVDIDLTKLSSTMVYSEVYNIVMMPDEYLGKTLKMQGNFRLYPDVDSDAVYFAVVIPDATACCEQGFEFVWDGEHSYPEDYPAENTKVEITGRLDTYEEDGYEYFYVVAQDFVVLD